MTPDHPASPAHGYDDDDETRRLLRSRPPRNTLQWAAAALGGGTVTSARPLRGGTSSAMHLLTVARTGGGAERVVLRRYVRNGPDADEPDIAENEQRALRFTAELHLPTPELIACDPTGARAGVPSLLMSRLAGRVDWVPSDVERWLRRLVEILLPVHAAPVPPAGFIRPFAPYAQRRYDPPAWSHRPRVWRRAVDIFHGPSLDDAQVFIHRDFHPGNVLWTRRTVSGVVDWQDASIGPPSVDVGHCRWNLLRYGQEVADRFTTLWERETGVVYHPWADVVAIVGFLDGLRDEPPREHLVVEAALGRAVAALSGDPV